MDKKALQNMYAALKTTDGEVRHFLEENARHQRSLIENFDVKHVRFAPYFLQFQKLKWLNTISSLPYGPRPGRNLDLLVFYEGLPLVILGHIRFSSPSMYGAITQYMKGMKETFGKSDLHTVNKHIVEMSVCVGVGPLTHFLLGKMIALVAISQEVIDLYNDRYGADIRALFTTSIYGKSSLYNRLRNFEFAGFTKGVHTFFTPEQRRMIKEKFAEVCPNGVKAYKGSCAPHTGWMVRQLLDKGIDLGFDFVPQPRGVYRCDRFLPILDNLQYWYERWFAPRRERIRRGEVAWLQSAP